MKHSDLIGMPDPGGSNRDHDGSYHRKNADIILADGFYIYIGNPNIDGTWRVGLVSGELRVEVRVDGTYSYRGAWIA